MEYFDQTFADKLMLKRSSLKNCKMTFINGRGFAECQILKKWKWPYLLNWVEYVDNVHFLWDRANAKQFAITYVISLHDNSGQELLFCM